MARHALLASLLVVTSLVSASSARASIVYDAETEFSIASNPNGVWRYGWSDTATSPFNLDTVANPGTPVDAWYGPSGGVFPLVSHNKSNSVFNSGTVQWEPHQLLLHPGPGLRSQEYAVIRFVAPAAGTYTVSSAFFGQDTVGTTTDVHLVINGSAVFSGSVAGFHSVQSYGQNNVILAAGDTVDVRVGQGGNGYGFDSTGVSFTISGVTAVPEPSAGLSALLGLVGFIAVRLRRRSA